MSGLDRHVVIVAAAGSFTVAGERLTGPVDSGDKLVRLIEWAQPRGLLELLSAPTRDGGQEPGRLWLIGEACELLGPAAEAADLREQLGNALAPLVARGWELRADLPSSLTVSRGRGAERRSVRILAEPRPWLAGGCAETVEDAAELARRLCGWYAAVGVLPAATAAGSAAVLADHIMNTRRHGAVVKTSGVLPSWVTPETGILPPWCAPASAVEDAFEQGDELTCVTQLCPRLASAGTAMFGYGKPEVLDTSAAASVAAAAKRPFALWRVTLPAANTLALPAVLPLPHPLMRAAEPVPGVWLSTEDLEGLTMAVRDGGAGVSVERLDVAEAVVWPEQGRVLEAWAKRIRDARESCETDRPLQERLEAAADEYLAALGDPSAWSDEGWQNHFQPAWAATIAARVRFRSRRKAMRIGREYRTWPLYAQDAAMIFAPGCDETSGEAIDLSETDTTRLGRLVATARVRVTDETVLAVLLAESSAEIASALTTAVALAAVEPTPAPHDPPASTAEDRKEDRAHPAAESAGEQAAPPTQPPPSETKKPPTPERTQGSKTTKKRSTGTTKRPGGTVAAVLHTDGLWFPDGTHLELVEPITHLGQVAALALEHNLGYSLTDNYAEPGQIWITEEACQEFGIDVSSIEKYDPAGSLRRITAGIDFVTLAATQGWKIGAGKKDREQGGDAAPASMARMGAWTRVYRDDDKDKVGVLVALVPGMGTDADMPILAGEPTPAQIARRIQLFADALQFPWKVGAGTTAIDLMLQTRPKTYSWKEWKGCVFAPSTTEPPYSLTDVERDYNWTRKPTSSERDCRYVHAYDRGASYPAAIAGLELPIGAPTHHPDGAPFDQTTPGYWLIEVPKQADWRLPYLLNPTAIMFNEPKWVTTPRLERAIALGYEPKILEAWIWEEHGRVLNGWYERLRDASVALDTPDPDALAARRQTKVMRTRAIGLLGSDTYLKGETGYSPERRFHIMAKANANIVYLCNEIGQTAKRWPVAAHTDTVLYVSDIADPIAAWPGKRAKLGTGFGQYKPEGSALLSSHAEFLDGGAYRGKPALLDPDDWAEAAEATSTKGA